MSLIRHGPLEMDLGAHRVWVDGEEKRLSVKQFKLLELFLRNPDRVLSESAIGMTLWKYAPSREAVWKQVSMLRKSVGSSVFDTVRGVGYRLSKP